MGLTTNFGFKTLGPGESIEDDNHQFGLADRELLDALLQATLDHHHDGSTAEDVIRPDAPLVELGTGEGILESGYTYEYKVAWVDEYGRESQGSEPTIFTLPDDLSTPNKPSLEFMGGDGTLSSGTYAYVVSAYRTDTYSETKSSLATAITLPRGNTHAIQLTIPDSYDENDEYDGFNVYRRRPGGQDFFYVGSTSAFDFTDDGLVDDCNRFAPFASTIGTDRVVNVSVDAVPEGYTWKVYRSSAPGLWDNSYLHHVVERTSEAPDAEVVVTYVDVGEGTAVGSPNEYGSFSFYNPTKINLTDGAEVQGILPASMVEGGGSGGGGGEGPLAPVIVEGIAELDPEHVGGMLVTQSMDPTYMMIPTGLDVPDGTRLHFLRTAPGEFGVWPSDPSIMVMSKDNNLGIDFLTKATLWKITDDVFVFYGSDLVPIDEPVMPVYDYYSLLMSHGAAAIYPLSIDAPTVLNDIVQGADVGGYFDAAWQNSTDITSEVEGPREWMPALEIGSEGVQGYVNPNTGLDLSGSSAITVEGLWCPGSAVVGEQRLFSYEDAGPSGSGPMRVAVHASDGDPFGNGWVVKLEEWDLGFYTGDPPNRTWDFAAFADPVLAGTWVHWAATVTLPSGGNDPVITFFLNGEQIGGNQGGVPAPVNETFGFNAAPAPAIGTSGSPDKFAGVAIFDGALEAQDIIDHYNALDTPPEGWEPVPMMMFRMSADSFDRPNAPELVAPDDGIPVAYEYDGDGSWEVSGNSAVFTGGTAGEHAVYVDTAGFSRFSFVMGEGDVGSTSTIEVSIGNTYYDLGARGDGYIRLNEAGEFWFSSDGEAPTLLYTLTNFPGFVVGETVVIEKLYNGTSGNGYSVSVGDLFEQTISSVEWEWTGIGGADYIGFVVNYVTGELPKKVDFWDVEHATHTMDVPKAFAGSAVEDIRGASNTGPGNGVTLYNGDFDWVGGLNYIGTDGSGNRNHYEPLNVTDSALKYARMQFDIGSQNQLIRTGFRHDLARKDLGESVPNLVRNEGLFFLADATSFLALRFSDDAGTGSMTLHSVNGGTETLLHTFSTDIWDALTVVPIIHGYTVVRAFIDSNDMFWLQVNGVTEKVDLSGETLPTGTGAGVFHRQTYDGATNSTDKGIGWYLTYGHALL